MLSGWTKSCNIQLYNSTSTLTDYQVKFIINRSSGTNSGDNIYVGTDCQADYGDIRFTDTSDNLLPYWIESYTASSATVWVKLTLAATAYTNIVLQYANTNTSTITTSNGDNTFVFFDDFATLDTSTKWTVTSSQPYSVSGGILTVTGGSDAADYIKSQTSFATNTALRMKSKWADAAGSSYFGYSTAIDANMAVSFNTTGYRYTTYVSAHNKSNTTVDSSWHTIDIARNGTSSVIFTEDGTVAFTSTSQIPTVSAGILFRQYTSTQQHDWVLIRNYSAVEPTKYYPRTLSEWTYRKSHTITHPTGGLTNYQTKIRVYRTTGTDSGDTVYVGDKCRADFGDIRFTNSAGTELPYWIEVNATTYADFWVKLDSITTSATFYIYYGNNLVTTTSNGNTTFDFFDDFTGSSIDSSKWTNISTGGTISVSDGRLSISGNIGAKKGLESVATFGAGTIVEATMSGTGSSSGGYLNFGYGWYGDNNQTCILDASDSDLTFWMYSKDTSVQSTSIGNQYTTDKSIKLGRRTNTQQVATYAGYSSITHSRNISTQVKICIGTWLAGNTATYSFDCIKIRKYSTVEPIHSTWGAEQDIRATSFTIQITPTSGTDPLSVTYNCIIPEGTLDNFTLNFGDGQKYTTPDTINTIFEKTRNAYTAGFPGCTFRSVLSAVDISSIGTVVRFKMVGPNDGTFIISHASIVERDGSTANGTTIPTEVTFNNGESGFTLDAGISNYIYSDWITYTIDETKDYLFIVDISLASTAGNAQGFSGTGYYKSGGATSWNTQNLESPNLYSFGQLCFKIETCTPTPQSSFATTHTYDTPGTYTVWGEGYTEFATHVYYEIPYGVTVTAPSVVASFTISQSYNTVTFTNTSTGNINECYWDFGDGLHSYETNPVHTYYSPATYNVTLYVSNQYQYSSATSSVTITQILTPPSAYFTPARLDVINPTLPYSVTFTNLSTPTFGCTYNWTVDGGTVSTSSDPTISFATHGVYDIGLTVTNSLGSSSRVYNDAIRLTRKSRTMNEVVGGADTFSTFGIQVFMEYATGSDLPIVYATILPEGVYFIQREIPDVPGIDEWGVRHLYSTINEWGVRIFTALNSWGHKILHNSSSVDRTPLRCIDVEIFEETMIVSDDHQFDEDPS